jgi:predicted nicotinamide N-methyase
MTKHSFEAFGLTILQNAHPDIRRLKKRYPGHSLHGNKVWQSSFVLMDYLQEYPMEPGSSVLEVGCGWGLAGIYCAKQFEAAVVALDADENVLPYLEHHAELNGVELNTIAMDIADITPDQLAGFDVIIGTDICFWDSLTDTVAELIAKAHSAGVSRTILTDPGRPSFRAMAERCQGEFNAFYSDWAVPAPLNTWGLVLELGA